jgi:DNA-binding CsgD family transcriptional regulator
MELLERDAPLGELGSLLTQARAGEGATVVVAGEPGIGKSSVLGALAEGARRDGVQVLRAAAGELEDDVAFGVVRALFSTVVDGAGSNALLSGAAALGEPVFRPQRAGDQAPGADVLHGLYWLLVNVCDVAPCVLIVDDVQWADAASLRFVSYVARRLDGLPCLLVLGLRVGVRTQLKPELETLCMTPGVERLELAALGVDGVQSLISARLGRPVEPALAAACHAATGGNPFLAVSLAVELSHRAAGGELPDVGIVDELGGQGIASWMRHRVRRCGPQASEVARAVAVLGSSASYRRVQMLAGVDDEHAEPIVDALIGEDILLDARPLAFTHPMLRAAVYGELGASLAARWHGRAAKLLATDGQQDEAAHHFGLAEPLGDPLAVSVLCQSAERALTRGAPEVAADYLTRALEEPPDVAGRAEIRRQLGAAELHAGRTTAAATLEQAYGEATDINLRAEIAVLLARCQLWAGDVASAVSTKERALAEGGDSPTLAALESDLLEDATSSPEARRLLAGRIGALRDRRDFGADEQRLMAILALELALTDGPSARAAALAKQALADGMLLAGTQGPDSHCWMALIALAVTGDRDALAGFAQVMARQAESGSSWTYGVSLAFRGQALLRFGALPDAEADLRTALDDRHGGANGVTAPLAVGALIQVVLERAGPDAAQDVVAEFSDVDINAAGATSDPLAFGRAGLSLARNLSGEALAELAACQSFERAFGGCCPAWSPWRLIAARARLATGERELAVALAAEHRDYATRFGGPNVIGAALHCSGLAEDSVAQLREAVEVLGASSDRLAHAHALVDLGAKLRSRRQLVDAREPLRAGLDVASACGARPLAERAQEELVIAGGRPRRPRTTGTDALTPAELRTARLAADGLTNREIAQAGFVSPRTVEMHLSNAYGKLGIESRDQLRGVLPEIADLKTSAARAG